MLLFVNHQKKFKIRVKGEKSVREQIWWEKDILKPENLVEYKCERLNKSFVFDDFSLRYQFDFVYHLWIMIIWKEKKTKQTFK